MNKEEEFELRDKLYQYTEPDPNGLANMRVWIRDIWDYLNTNQMQKLYTEKAKNINTFIHYDIHHIADMEKRIAELEKRVDSFNKKLELILNRASIALDKK